MHEGIPPHERLSRPERVRKFLGELWLALGRSTPAFTGMPVEPDPIATGIDELERHANDPKNHEA